MWTPADRNDFIAEAVNSDDMYGERDGYVFNVLSQNMDECKREKATMCTEAVAEVVNRPEFKPIIMSFYFMLFRNLACSPYTENYFSSGDIVMVMKGNSAYRYLAANGGGDKEAFGFSDMDIMVCVNPWLSKAMFEGLKSQVDRIVKQTMSQYKRMLDDMLYGNVAQSEFVDAETAANFKKTLSFALGWLQVFTPFLPSVDCMYEACSKNSFIVTDSMSHVVRVEVPHFDNCERIPLRRSPLVCSFNNSIDFMRDGEGGSEKGKFNLYRLKMNMLMMENGCMERIAADFIDVCVPAQDDAELAMFWESGSYVNVWDADVGFYVAVPDVWTCIDELERILYEYESCDAKKEKRERKLAALRAMA